MGLSAYKPGINHACKSSHLKSFTKQRPSCNTEFLVLGKYCVDFLADLMIQIIRYRKYLEGCLCPANPLNQRGGWGMLHQSCSCSGRQCPEIMASPRVRLRV